MKHLRLSFGVLLIVATAVIRPYTVNAQLDSATHHLSPLNGFVLSCGLNSDFPGSGVIADLSVLLDKDVFGLSFSTAEIGEVVTYSQGGNILEIFSGGSVTSYAAHLTHTIALSYGKKLTGAIWLTTGVAWLTKYERSAKNGHSDPGGFLRSGDYHADLVEESTQYPAIPLTLTVSLFKSRSWIGMNLHGQMLMSLNEIRFSAGASIGLGSYPE